MPQPRNAALEFGQRMEALKRAGKFSNNTVPVMKATIKVLMEKRRTAEKQAWHNYICDFNALQLRGKGKRIAVTDIPHTVIKTVIHDRSNQRNTR